jgi:carboxyl-terminal processing protease
MNQETDQMSDQIFGLDPEAAKRLRKEVRAEVRSENFNKGILFGLLIGIIIAGFIYCIVTLNKFARQETESEPVTEQTSILDDQAVQKMHDIETIIYSKFYQNEIDAEQMKEGAYRGMLESLNDPYSVYWTAEEYREQTSAAEGIYYGIGAYVSMDEMTNYPKISGVIDDAPAQEVGLREDDILYEADGQNLQGLSLTEVVALIKGEEGTTVKLTIYRESTNEYLDFDVVRRRVESPTVTYEMLDDAMAYIAITEFDTVTIEQFYEALQTAKDEQMEGLILDLRANPGGTLTAVLEIAKMMLPKGLVLYSDNKYGERTEYHCEGLNKIEVPVVVLVDQNSASAAEVLAGAMKDHGIATLVGMQTYGKGIIQQIYELKDGSAIKVTVSSYFTPAGTDINGVGITPDVICEFDAEAYYAEESVDNQLEKAIEVLSQKIGESQ